MKNYELTLRFNDSGDEYSITSKINVPSFDALVDTINQMMEEHQPGVEVRFESVKKIPEEKDTGIFRPFSRNGIIDECIAACEKLKSTFRYCDDEIRHSIDLCLEEIKKLKRES